MKKWSFERGVEEMSSEEIELEHEESSKYSQVYLTDKERITQLEAAINLLLSGVTE